MKKKRDTSKKRQARNRKPFASFQEQALRVNAINTEFTQKVILHYVDSVMKRQSITRILIACSMLVISQYRKRHDNVGTSMHLLLCKKHHLQCSIKLYKHINAHIHTHTHTHTHTHQNQSREMTNIKSFGISIFKQIKL